MQHNIEAEITFLPTEHGGRSGPVFNGYRPQFYYDGYDWDARYEYPNHKQVQLGQKIVAYISFLSPYEHMEKFILAWHSWSEREIELLDMGWLQRSLIYTYRQQQEFNNICIGY